MYRILYILLLLISINTQPIFAQTRSVQIKTDLAFFSENFLGLKNNLRTQNKNNVNFNLEYSKRSLSSQLSLNFDDHDKLSFDNSYVNYKKGIANLNIGKVDRIWSFSEKSSLILSSNSRPLEALSLKFENRFNTKWSPLIENWSVELINGSTKNSYNDKNSMLSGARVVISPSDKLNFELLQ